MRLREYKDSDLEAIFALDQVCFAPPFRFSKRAMRRFAESRNALTVVAEDEGTGVAGFAIAHVERRVGYVVTLDVAPRCRRRGLAGWMMRTIEGQARAAGCEAMELHASVENAGAIAFYQREEYERVGLAKGFYGVGRDAWVYRKRIPLMTAMRPSS